MGAQPRDGQNASHGPPNEPESDFTSAAIFGGSDDYYEYAKSTKNSPLSSANTPNLAGHIRKLEMMHEISVEEINAIV